MSHYNKHITLMAVSVRPALVMRLHQGLLLQCVTLQQAHYLDGSHSETCTGHETSSRTTTRVCHTLQQAHYLDGSLSETCTGHETSSMTTTTVCHTLQQAHYLDGSLSETCTGHETSSMNTTTVCHTTTSTLP